MKYLNLSERADIELANDLKYENYKYMNLSTAIGLNVGFFSYQALKTKLYWYVALPLGFGAYFVARNIVMRNCMDRIYYPGEMVYKRYRGTDAEAGKTQEVLKKEKIVAEEKASEKPAKKKYEATKEDLAKGKLMRLRNQNLAIEESAKQHFEEHKSKEKERIDDFIHQIHGKWINETDFCDYTFDYIKQSSNGSEEIEKLIYQEIDKKEESSEQYDRFVNLYIQLYYEPLVEEYDEIKYFTRNHD